MNVTQSKTTRRSAIAALAGVGFTPLPAKAAKKATAFALIGDRYHNSDYIRTGLTRTVASQMGVSVDFTDETSLLNAETLDGYKVLIVLRDGMIWPNGYGGDESTNAAWVAMGVLNWFLIHLCHKAKLRHNFGLSLNKARQCGSL